MLTQDPNLAYQPNADRYTRMAYPRCGASGVRLPALSLGLWQNFGGADSLTNARAMVQCAFDLGITQFDLANNYGPPYGSAETTFVEILRRVLATFRNEFIISSNTVYDMSPVCFGIV